MIYNIIYYYMAGNSFLLAVEVSGPRIWAFVYTHTHATLTFIHYPTPVLSLYFLNDIIYILCVMNIYASEIPTNDRRGAFYAVAGRFVRSFVLLFIYKYKFLLFASFFFRFGFFVLLIRFIATFIIIHCLRLFQLFWQANLDMVVAHTCYSCQCCWNERRVYI